MATIVITGSSGLIGSETVRFFHDKGFDVIGIDNDMRSYFFGTGAVQCAVTGRPYTIYGYKAKQVRDNIHSYDLVNAFWHYCEDPKPAAIYNMGGSRHSNCSVLEAIALIEELSGFSMNYTFLDEARSGDHIWWISDVRCFQRDYPNWKYRYNLREIVAQIVQSAWARSLGAS